MIPLPPGCTVNYEVILTLNSMPEDFLVWFEEVGGKVGLTEWIDMRGKSHVTPVVQYGLGRPSHKFNNGTGEYLVRFRSEDAGVALMLLMKWDNLVVSHNMREVEKYVY